MAISTKIDPIFRISWAEWEDGNITVSPVVENMVQEVHKTVTAMAEDWYTDLVIDILRQKGFTVTKNETPHQH